MHFVFPGKTITPETGPHRSFNKFVYRADGERSFRSILFVFYSIPKRQYLPNVFLRDVIGLSTSERRKIQIVVNQDRNGGNIMLFSHNDIRFMPESHILHMHLAARSTQNQKPHERLSTHQSTHLHVITHAYSWQRKVANYLNHPWIGNGYGIGLRRCMVGSLCQARNTWLNSMLSSRLTIWLSENNMYNSDSAIF